MKGSRYSIKKLGKKKILRIIRKECFEREQKMNASNFYHGEYGGILALNCLHVEYCLI
jgi:hypothetical protein